MKTDKLLKPKNQTVCTQVPEKTPELTKWTRVSVKTPELTKWTQVPVKAETETNEERQARWLAVAIETKRQWLLKQDAKPKKVAVSKTPDIANMTIQQEDYWHRKEMREAMEEDDADIFSYNW